MKESRETKKKLADLVADALQKAEKQQGYWMNYTGGAFAQAASVSSESARPMTLLMKVLQQEDSMESGKSVETALSVRDRNLENFKDELLDVTEKIDAHLVPLKPSVDGADFDDVNHRIELPVLAAYAHPLEYAHDLYNASSLATGSSEGFNRPGVEHSSPSYSQQASLREQLVSELATGILLAEHGRPAILAPDSLSLAGQWAEQFRKDPEFAKGVFWDVNRAVEAIRQVKQGQDVDYAGLMKIESPSEKTEGKKGNGQSPVPGPMAMVKSVQEQKAAERQVELLTNALSEAREKGGIWMNEGSRFYPSFYPKGPAVSPFNAIAMTLHSDRGNYPSNLYTTFNEAKQRGESVQSGQKGVPFLWYNWNKYVNRNNPDEVLTRKQYLELPKEERQQYKGIHEREVRMLFNVDQTMTPMIDPDGLKSVMDRHGVEKEDLKESVKTFIGAISENLVSIQPSSGTHSAGYDSKDDIVRMPDADTYAHYPDYIHDLIAETVRATGYGDRLAREGGRQNAEGESRIREELIVEMATGVKMLELGLPAKLSFKAQDMVEAWNRQLREDSRMIDAVEADVNNAMEVIHKAEQGEKIEYASIVNRQKVQSLQEKQKPQVSSEESLVLSDIIAHHGMEIHRSNFNSGAERDAFLDKFSLRYYNEQVVDAMGTMLAGDPELKDAALSHAQQHAASIEELAREYLPAEWTLKGRHDIESSIREQLSLDKKDFAIIVDSENRRADVVLREGAFAGGKVILPNGTEHSFSLSPDEVMTASERKEADAKVQYNDAPGFSKERIEKAIEKQGLGVGYVRFFNTEGVLGYHPDDRYFENKNLYITSLSNWSLSELRQFDASEAVLRAQKPQFDRINMVKDDDGRWVLYIKPTEQEPFGIHPDKEDVNRFFTVAHDGNEEQTAFVRDELAVKYYELAQVKPDLKVNLLGERATEEDAARLHDVHIFKNKQGQYMLIAKLSDTPSQIPPRVISAAQWQRLWLSPDHNQYKVDLAAKIFSDVLHPEQERETSVKQTSPVPNPHPVKESHPEEKPKTELSPLLKQFLDLKKKHPEALLLFRTGDFYQTYKQDAESASKILGITLTRSTRIKDDEGKPLAMAGFPYHALDSYLPKLIRAGQRVAICDQIEDPRQKSVEQDDDSEQVEEKETQSRRFHR